MGGRNWDAPPQLHVHRRRFHAEDHAVLDGVASGAPGDVTLALPGDDELADAVVHVVCPAVLITDAAGWTTAGIIAPSCPVSLVSGEVVGGVVGSHCSQRVSSGPARAAHAAVRVVASVTGVGKRHRHGQLLDG